MGVMHMPALKAIYVKDVDASWGRREEGRKKGGKEGLRRRDYKFPRRPRFRALLLCGPTPRLGWCSVRSAKRERGGEGVVIRKKDVSNRKGTITESKTEAQSCSP